MGRNKKAFIYDRVLASHSLGESHPLIPTRLRYTYELLQNFGAFDVEDSYVVKPRKASFDEVTSFHTQNYATAVSNFSRGHYLSQISEFNLSASGDNPVYPGMYEAGLWSVGGSLKAVELLLEENFSVATNLSGGLHHAMPGYASGFCVFNDPVIAINQMVNFGLRVAYVDIDCHHGDGVEAAFYENDKVLTISLHESGNFLFPGTGFCENMGFGKGLGYAINLPLHPDTDDEVYESAFTQVVPPIIQAFRPEILVTQIGIDTHFRDPLTHLRLTVRGFENLIHKLSLLSPGRWLVLGGGGYDLRAVVQGWAGAYGIILNQSWPEKTPKEFRGKYGVEVLHDPLPEQVPSAARELAFSYAQRGVNFIRKNIFPIHGI